jgi:hypothetical protein
MSLSFRAHGYLDVKFEREVQEFGAEVKTLSWHGSWRKGKRNCYFPVALCGLVISTLTN